jgi:3-oxoacyl-[acyl-carrier-protein] synthase-3
MGFIMYQASIIGTGSYVPERILTNHHLKEMVDTSDKWIVERTGIRERRIAGNGETNVSMGKIALERAIEDSEIQSEEIEFLVVGTNTTEPVWPSAGGHIANLLDLRKDMPFVDVQAGCTGFNYALSIAEMSIKAGQYKTVGVVGTDKLSAITDYQDRNTCVLFGDGAGALILKRSAGEGIIRSHLGGNSKLRDLLILSKKDGAGNGYILMEGRKVYTFAKRAMVESCLRVLDPSGTAGKDKLRDLFQQVTKIIPHQANARIIMGAAEDLESKLELPDGEAKNKMIMTIEQYGNNSCASIPLALDLSLRAGTLKKGDLVIFVGFGAGLTYAANLVRL